MSDLGHKFTPDYRGTGIRSGDYVETSWRVAKRISQCLLEEAGKAEERDGPAGQGYADAIAAIDPNAPERYGEQLTVALKKISLDSSVPSELEEDCGLKAFVSLLVKVCLSGDDKLRKLVSALASALSSEGLSRGYLLTLRDRVLDDCLVSYILEPEAPKRIKEIIALYKEGADPTRKYGEGCAAGVMLVRGYLDLYRRAASFDKCRDAILDIAISYPASSTPAYPEYRDNAERVIYYVFSNLMPPTYDDGRFFRLCVMYKKWKLAKLGMKAFVNRGGNAAALADYLASTVGYSKGNYSRMFAASLHTAKLGYEILRSIAREAAAENHSSEARVV